MQILTAVIPDPTALLQDQLAGAIRGVHIHLDDPSVCITQAQIICVYSGKLGQSSPGRCRKRPPHVHFKGAAAEWKQVCLVRSRAQGGPGWMEEGRRDPCRPVCVWWKREWVHVCPCTAKAGRLIQYKVRYDVAVCKYLVRLWHLLESHVHREKSSGKCCTWCFRLQQFVVTKKIDVLAIANLVSYNMQLVCLAKYIFRGLGFVFWHRFYQPEKSSGLYSTASAERSDGWRRWRPGIVLWLSLLLGLKQLSLLYTSTHHEENQCVEPEKELDYAECTSHPAASTPIYIRYIQYIYVVYVTIHTYSLFPVLQAWIHTWSSFTCADAQMLFGWHKKIHI